MSIPLAAVGAVVAALLETSVLPAATAAGPRADLVLVLTVVSTMVLGIEDGLTWAFVGGLMLDFLEPEHQVGTSSLVLLLVAGLAVGVARLLPQRRALVAALTVFALSWVYQALSIVVLTATAGTPTVFQPVAMAATALIDGVLGLAVAIVVRALWLRFGQHDRIEW
jgi:rod shape-determining protein MreD